VSDVKRYDLEHFDYQGALYEAEDGKYVLADDYAHLQRRCEELEKTLALAEPYMSPDGFMVDHDHYNMVKRMVRDALLTSGANSAHKALGDAP
jgi:hypothetical protein